MVREVERVSLVGFFSLFDLHNPEKTEREGKRGAQLWNPTEAKALKDKDRWKLKAKTEKRKTVFCYSGRRDGGAACYLRPTN